MKKVICCLAVVLAAIAMAFGFVGCSNDALDPTCDPNTYAFVTIDINPSIELVTLGNSVIEVKAANYDACVLLDGEDFSSLDVEQATERIVALAEQMGYLNSANNEVKITVLSDNAQTVEILKAAAKSGAQKGSKLASLNSEPRLQDELALKKLKADKPDKFATLTEEKVRLIESVMEHDRSMTYEQGAEMTVNELAAALESSLDDSREIFTDELRSEYSARYTAQKQAIEREIAAVYGQDYLDAWESYTALYNEYNAIATALDRSGLSDEDMAVVKESLGISDVSLIQKGGIVKPEYVLNHIDKHIYKKATTVDGNAIESALAILDKYDPDNYVLTDDERIRLSAAVDGDVEYATLAEVAMAVAEQKALLHDRRQSVRTGQL